MNWLRSFQLFLLYYSLYDRFNVWHVCSVDWSLCIHVHHQKGDGVSAMLLHKAYKFRIYPNREQSVLIAKTIGSARFVYNHFLHLWNETYLKTGKGLSYHSCSAMLPKMKKDTATFWLKEVDSIALQSSLKNLANSFTRFFTKQNSKPQFISKNNPVQSYTTQFTNNNIVVSDKYIKLPKLGSVKFAEGREVKGRIINATISRNPSGKYFVSKIGRASCRERV